MARDRIEELLKADEEALKAKRGRFVALTRAIKEWRSTQDDARSSAQAVLDADSLSRAALREVFGLTPAELAVLLPPAPRGKFKSSGPTSGSNEVDDAGHEPEDTAHQVQA